MLREYMQRHTGLLICILLLTVLTACGGGGGNTPTTFTINVSAGVGGNITPSAPQTVNPGTTTTFLVTPDPGYSIQSVTGCDGDLVGNTYTTGIINSSCVVTVFFSSNVPTTFTINVSAGVGGNITPSAPQTVNPGTTTTFLVTPDPGYSIQSVTGCDGDLVGNTYTTGIINSSCVVTVLFSLESYDISIGVIPAEAGSVSGGGTFEHGTEVTIIATPNSGYRFLHWLENESIVSDVSNYTFIATADRQLIANLDFTNRPPNLTANNIIVDSITSRIAVNYIVSDPDGDPVDLHIAIEPLHGKLEFDAQANQLIYLFPNVGFFNDRFFLVATDGELESEVPVNITYLDTNLNGIPDFIDPAFGNSTLLSGIESTARTLNQEVYVISDLWQISATGDVEIQAGTHLYLADDARLVVAGEIRVLGEVNNPVRILPASIDPEGWDKIIFVPGHSPSQLDSTRGYQSGFIMRGTEIAGFREFRQTTHNGIEICPADNSSYYLFDTIFMHSSFGTRGVEYFGNSTCSGGAWVIVINSVIDLDDRTFQFGSPSTVFDRFSINFEAYDTIFRGYYFSGIWYPIRLERVLIDMRKAFDFSTPLLNLEGWLNILPPSSPLPSVTDSIVNGTLSLFMFDGNIPTFENNILRQTDDEKLIIIDGDPTVTPSYTLPPNFYDFSGSLDEIIIDGHTDVTRPILDLSLALEFAPVVGPNNMDLDGDGITDDVDPNPLISDN